MSRPRILDLFCGAGGASMGYWRAGFEVYGVDIQESLGYPFERATGDALDYLERHASEFDAIHASPPCQGYLNLTRQNAAMGRASASRHSRMIAATREAILATGLPYVIENVPDARTELIDPVRLCGTSFGLPLRRHRLFESNIPLAVLRCDHARFSEPKYWTGWRPNGEHRLSTVVQVYGNAGGREHWPAAMGIDWMTSKELVEAIPPAFTGHIGRQLLDHVSDDRVALTAVRR